MSPQRKHNRSSVGPWTLLAIMVGALVVPEESGAAEPEGANDKQVRPATWDMSIDQLRAIGLGQSRGEPIPVPAHLPRLRAPDQPPSQAQQGVMFINYDGAQLSSGSDDSTQNRTQIGQLAGNYAAYGQGAKRDAVTQAVRTDWAAYNVVVTDTRPAAGDYTMNMTGPSNAFGQGVLGIAPLDCNDSQTHNNITYAFHSVNDNFSASTTATTIGQEVAHSYGLEHVDEPGDIMNPFNAGGDPSFRDECISIVSDQGIVCGGQHSAQCGSSQLQNSHAELLELFGPSAPDGQQPVVSITAPNDGTAFPTGSDFDITVTASDDTGIQEVTLFSNGSNAGADASEPYGWTVSDVPAGTYELYVEARDLAGNTTQSNIVVITVSDDATPPGQDDGAVDDGTPDGGDSADGGDGDGGDDGDGGADGDADGGSEGGDGDVYEGDTDAGLPPGYGGQNERGSAEGCACTTDDGGARGLGGLALLMLAFGFGRRRRGRT